MRKRSGGLHCESEEEYIRLAEISQDNLDLFYSGHPDLDDNGEIKDLEGYSSRRAQKYQRNAQQNSSSQDDNSNTSRHNNQNDDEEQSTDEEYLMDDYVMEEKKVESDEIDSLIQMNIKIMLVGEFPNIFREHLEKQNSYVSDNDNNKLIDFALYKENISFNKNIVYKIWQRNTNIIQYKDKQCFLDIYYKYCQYFFYIYDTFNQESFEKIKNHKNEHLLQEGDKLIFLIGVTHPNKPKVITTDQINEFSSKLKIRSVFEVGHQNFSEFIQHIFNEIKKLSNAQNVLNQMQQNMKNRQLDSLF